MSPTERTLRWLRKQGWEVDIAERYNHYSRTRHDLFGFADLVALPRQGHGILALQVTSGANLAARKSKVAALSTSRRWLGAGGRIWCVGWRKLKKGWTPSVWSLEGGEWVEVVCDVASSAGNQTT